MPAAGARDLLDCAFVRRLEQLLARRAGEADHGRLPPMGVAGSRGKAARESRGFNFPRWRRAVNWELRISQFVNTTSPRFRPLHSHRMTMLPSRSWNPIKR